MTWGGSLSTGDGAFSSHKSGGCSEKGPLRVPCIALLPASLQGVPALCHRWLRTQRYVLVFCPHVWHEEEAVFLQPGISVWFEKQLEIGGWDFLFLIFHKSKIEAALCFQLLQELCFCRLRPIKMRGICLNVNMHVSFKSRLILKVSTGARMNTMLIYLKKC